MMNQVLDNRTTAIYGDPNVQAATVVPNLNNVSDGTNLNVISDSGQLKLYQALTLNDNFYDTRTEEVFQTNVSNNVVAIQGALMGWCNKQDFVLGVQSTIQFTTANVVFNDHIAGGISHWIQPEFAILQPFVRIEVKLGNNNQIVQRNMMNYAQGLRLIALDQSYNWAQSMIAAELGLPYSVGNAIYNVAWGGAINQYTPNSSYEEVEMSYRSRWNQIKDSLWQNAAVAPIAVEFGIPLGMVNSFFAENAFLPAGLPFRIELEYTTGAHYIAYSSATSPFAPAAQPNDNAINLSFLQNFSLRYRSHILKAHIQDSINNEWITKPLLYQFDTYEYVEIVGDGSTRTLLKDIAINQQRPTTLLFRIMSTNNTTNSNPVTLGTLPGDGRATWVYPNSSAGMFRYANMFIYIGGRQNYYLRMDGVNPAWGSMPSTSAGAVNAIVSGRCYDEVNQKPLTSFSSPMNFFTGKPFRTYINPGDFVKKGYMSTDAGALVIRVQTDVLPLFNPNTGAIPSTMKLVIYKKYPEQLQINAAKNINTIQWPAVAASNNYLIPSTYNMN